MATVNVNAVFDQALDSLCEQLRDQHIAVVQDPRQDLPLIQADELQIEQALHNILRNAIEAMSGGGSLRTGAALSDDGVWVEIRIQDTGDGIRDQDRKRVFQSFFTTKIKGTGLGLTIVQRVLRNHGGEIFLEQPETGGTRALVRLPVGMGRNGDGRGTMDEGREKKGDGEHIEQVGVEGKAQRA